MKPIANQRPNKTTYANEISINYYFNPSIGEYR